MKLSSKSLLLVAAIVWLLAGVNVAILGIEAYAHELNGWLFWVLCLGTLAIFLIFHIKVFSKMVVKHSNRIYGYGNNRVAFYRFFDKKGYLIMGIMMGGGFGLRALGVVPEWFIAFFYTGLGLALALAGVSFAIRYFKSSPAPCPVASNRND